MKTQNTLENKARFFAQYWCVKCLKNELLNQLIPAQKVDKSNCNGLPQQFLELKPLSQIGDEDAIHGLKLIISSRNSSAFDYCKSQNYSIEQMVNYFNRHLVYDFKLILTDYLRSKGYALPWMDLSVEDLVEYGWIKLKED